MPIRNTVILSLEQKIFFHAMPIKLTLTSCQEFKASQRLMNPGDPLSTVTGSFGSVVNSWAGF